jgi:hypothetical protein
VVYVARAYNDNVSFFLCYGTREEPNITYVLVINGRFEVPGVPSYVHVIKRDNSGYDFDAVSQVLWSLSPDGLPDYDRYIIVNSTVRGPFLPSWAKRHWSYYFSRSINDRIKLVGISIGSQLGLSYVQSMLLCTDRTGLKLAIDGGIYTQDTEVLTNDESNYRELELSKLIIDAGYGIDCMQTMRGGIDYRRLIQPYNSSRRDYNSCLGKNIDPLETIFAKIDNVDNRVGRGEPRIFLDRILRACSLEGADRCGESLNLYLTGNLPKRLIDLSLGIIAAIASGRNIVTNGLEGIDSFYLRRSLEHHYKIELSIREIPEISPVDIRTCEELATILDRDSFRFGARAVGRLGEAVEHILPSLIPAIEIGRDFVAIEDGTRVPLEGEIVIGADKIGLVYYCSKFFGRGTDLSYVCQSICRVRGIPYGEV